MGVYILAIAQYNFKAQEITAVPELLAVTIEAFSAHSSVLKKWQIPPLKWPIELREDSPLQWEWAEDFYPDEEFCAELNGPYGTWIEFGRTLFVVHPPLKWGAFVDDQEVQKSIVALCEAIVLCLGGKAILYVPDSAYCPSRASDFIFEDVDFDFLIDFLHKQCSPSAATISEIGRDLSNEEMLSLVPSWSVGSEGRIRNYDGYYVKYF